MLTIDELEQYLIEEENIRKTARAGYKSSKIQLFIREYGYNEDIDTIEEPEIWKLVQEHFPSMKLKRSYFRSVCQDAWVVSTDRETNIMTLHLDRQKVIKERRNCKGVDNY